jgi:hypothetical protein
MDIRRFFEFTEYDPDTECLNWTGSTDDNGYGKFYVSGVRTRKAHRFAWFIEHGEFPEHTTEHTCKNRRCVNVAHLDDIPQAQQADSAERWQQRKTHCPKDHEYTEQNTRWSNRKNGSRFRVCRECERIRTHAKRKPGKRGPARKERWDGTGV